MKKYLIYGAIGLAILAMLLPSIMEWLPSNPASVTPSTSNTTKETPKEVKNVDVPTFSGEDAFKMVEKQLSFGTRVPNTKGHKACKDWLVSQFKTYGATVVEQPVVAKNYEGTTLNGTNIIAQYNPGSARRIILAAHWDTRPMADSDENEANRKKPIMGADDGASGVAVLLEVAEELQKKAPGIGVDLILFDLEDWGAPEGYTKISREESTASWCLGSQYWAKNPHIKGYHANYGILLDMVGSNGARFAKEGVSIQVAPGLVNKVWRAAQNLGYGNYFVADQGAEITDDHVAVIRDLQIPMIDIINLQPGGGFGAHHHTLNDNIKIIDSNTMKAVGQTLLHVVYNEAAENFL